MKLMKYTFSTVEELVSFVTKAEKCSFPIEVVCGHLTIDGKSLIGIMAVGLGRQVEIICYDETASPEELVGHIA